MTSPSARRRRVQVAIVVVAVLSAVVVAVAVVVLREDDVTALTFERHADPARTVARDGSGDVVAVFTDGARTTVLSGPERTVAEPATTGATITTRAIVRLAPQPWRDGAEHADWFRSWFANARYTAEPDVIAIATQYLHGAPDQRDGHGIRFAGAARFGPVREGVVSEFSDFTDYLGAPWTYPDGTIIRPNADRFGALDCSGFIRVLYGYRSGYPMEFMTPTGKALPRRAVMMAEHGPGVVIVADSRVHSADIGRLQPGDLVFFDVDPVDGPQVDHVGIYLGIDSTGHRRFISSRKTNDGPTLGDVGGVSSLDGTGLYARGFRSARRL